MKFDITTQARPIAIVLLIFIFGYTLTSPVHSDTSVATVKEIMLILSPVLTMAMGWLWGDRSATKRLTK